MNLPQSHLRIAPGEESIEHIDNAIERAMNELTPDQTYHTTPEKEEPKRSLIKRSRVSFENNLQALQANIDEINGRIADAVRMRDEKIAKVNDIYKRWLHDIERELYQISTVKAAIELALAGLAHDPEQ